MKKGLSKILSLACVFALLLTMALPAMAAVTEVTDAVAYSNGTTWATDAVADGPAKIGAPVVLATDEAETGITQIGVFVREGNAIKMRTVNTVTLYKVDTYYWKANDDGDAWEADSAAATAAKKENETVAGGVVTAYTTTKPTVNASADYDANKKPTETVAADAKKVISVEEHKVVLEYKDGKYVYGDAKDGKVETMKQDTADGNKYKTSLGDVYFFEGEALVTNELYVYSNGNNNSETWSIAGPDKDRAEAAKTNPHQFKATAAGGVIEDDLSNAQTRENKGVIEVLGKDGKWVAVEGEVYYSVANGVVTSYNKDAYDTTPLGKTVGYQKDGKAFGGVVETPAKDDEYGNTTPASVALYEFEDGCALSKVKEYANTVTGPQTVKTGYNEKTKKATAEKTYLVVKGKIVIKGDSDGKYAIKTVDKNTRYLLNEDGTIRTNKLMAKDEVKNAPDFYSPTPAVGKNLVRVDNKKFDPYEDVEIDIDGVAQRYCLDKTGKVVVNDYRRLIDTDGTDLGVAYYTSDGITYVGWVEGDKAYKYQTNVEGRYIIVTGLQKLEEGVDPTDDTKKIDAGFYLFDANGSQIKTKTAKLDGHTFKLKDGVVTDIDGHEPTEADIFTAK